jgi:hypothetical protein
MDGMSGCESRNAGLSLKSRPDDRRGAFWYAMVGIVYV